MSKTRLKMEAIERMKLVKLDKSVVKEFENENKLNYSKSGYVIFPNALNNTLHVATSEPLTSEMEEVVAKFEAREKSCLVYHVIFTEASFGRLYNILFIDSEEEEDWKYEKIEMEYGIINSYVENVTNPNFSEYGSIAVEEFAGALIRKV
ncbi:hypothetical protein [Listeria seeligeri]|uniref:hypothetical protein n=1 Tax=Listeria seeligeri TaxID=1640 RepID=UPI0022EBB51B|nr:hypothetical protein [Listeria seeligeri]